MAEMGHSENMLVKQENLDKLLLLAGEVIIASSNIEMMHKKLLQIFDSASTIDVEALDNSKDLATSTALISGNLHRLVQAIRMVDLKDLSFRSRRLVRDISRKTGKRIVFEFLGEDTIVDKTIIEKLYDPVSHQLRNAVDHGIEDSREREKNKKNKDAKITLKAYNTEKETFIEISDDGGGVNLERIREKAIENGLVKPDEQIDESKALSLMCMPGFSTSGTVSEVSGRGVGMDVVYREISNIGGSVSLKTELGVGSTFTFVVPLISAVNILDALLVRSGSSLYAFPIANVIANLFIPRKEIKSTQDKGKMIPYLGTMLPLFDMNYVLDRRVEGDDFSDENIPVLVIEHKDERVALRIDEFFSPQKLVIIPFDESLKVHGLSGTTILSGKKIGFIVDCPALIKRASGDFIGIEKKHGLKKEVGISGSVSNENAESLAGEVKPSGTETAIKENKEVSPDAPETPALEFMIEIEKLMPTLNEAIFSLESDPSNQESINEAFRLFHTIKGNVIMMGLPKTGETIHNLESVLDRARSKKIEMDADVMDVLMDGISFIEEVISSSKNNSWKDKGAEDILVRSAKLLPEQKQDTKPIVDVFNEEFNFSRESAYRQNHYRKKGVPFYQIYFEFDSGKQPSFLIACLIYRRLSEAGDIIGSVPYLVDVEKGIMEGKLKLLIASEIEADLLEKSITALVTKHYGASVVKFKRFD